MKDDIGVVDLILRQIIQNMDSSIEQTSQGTVYHLLFYVHKRFSLINTMAVKWLDKCVSRNEQINVVVPLAVLNAVHTDSKLNAQMFIQT